MKKEIRRKGRSHVASRINIQANGRFSTALKEALDRPGLSLAELAEAVDSTYEHMRKLVGGRAYPSQNLLIKLARVTHADLETWEEHVEWDKIHEQYGCIPDCVKPREEMVPFAKLIPRLSQTGRSVVLGAAKALLEAQRKR